MRHTDRNRCLLSALVGGVAIVTVYEFAGTGVSLGDIPTYFVAIAAFLIASRVTAFVYDVVSSVTGVRALSAGSGSVEGHWFVNPPKEAGDSSPLNRPGMVFIDRDPETSELQVVTSRLGDDGQLFTTTSEIAYVRGQGSSTRYLEYFRIAYPGPSATFGVTAGEFTNPDRARAAPSLLETHTTIAGEGKLRRQQATRIDAATRRKWRRHFGNFWVQKFLESGGDLLAARPEEIASPVAKRRLFGLIGSRRNKDDDDDDFDAGDDVVARSNKARDISSDGGSGKRRNHVAKDSDDREFEAKMKRISEARQTLASLVQKEDREKGNAVA